MRTELDDYEDFCNHLQGRLERMGFDIFASQFRDDVDAALDELERDHNLIRRVGAGMIAAFKV